MTNKTLVVIGGGAAGYFSAIHAAFNFPGLRVILLEKSAQVLAKVRISGGGRCNVTHHCFEPSELAENYPRGAKHLKRLFYNFGPIETIEWFEKQGVVLKTEADGRMFPTTDQSQTIIDALQYAAQKAGVAIKMQSAVQALLPLKDGFELQLNGGNLRADYVIVASGGAPKSTQLEWLRMLGHQISEPVPSLFTFNLIAPITDLMGVAVPARVQIVGFPMVSEGPLLITHWGLSGPAVLRLSAFAARHLAERQYTYTVRIHWLPALNEAEIRQALAAEGSKAIKNQRWHQLPKRLWEALVTRSQVRGNLSWPELSKKEQNRLVEVLMNDTHAAQGKTTFKEEFVTAGGVSLESVNMKTLESKALPGLFFAGEVLDIDGVTGGFNFQAAWTTGYIAAKLGQ
jgi:predicted Rossmann fold flavoprotein